MKDADVCVATPVVTDAVSVKRLRHGWAVELKWKPSASDGTGLILYVVEGISIDSDTTDYTSSARWMLLTRVTNSVQSPKSISIYLKSRD